MGYTFSSPAHKDWRLLVDLDPSIATYRRCTSEDMRRLAVSTGWEYTRVKRAFNLRLFQRTKYLTLSLDPSFEPKPEVRERAKRLLEKRAKKKAHLKAMRKAIQDKELRKATSAQPIKRPTTPERVTLKKPLLSRYKF